ncbi:MAG: NUDIX hydrolase [Bacteroidota bacterium]|nr:NUDIX hydrolase [Bacteroidota bacterium]
MNRLNPHISVDCVIFGFDGLQLKVLLNERELLPDEDSSILSDLLKLPGSLISDTEELDISAYRVLKELTGLDKIFLKQFAVFGSPNRLQNTNDVEWLRKTSGMSIERVVTIAYYSLVKINESNPNESLLEKTSWIPLNEVPQLIFDHNIIVNSALEALRKEMRTDPIGFELLPKKFTLRQLQNLYEVIMGNKLDNRNFRKRIVKLNYLVPLSEKEKGVSHKPAQLYKFDKKTFLRERKDIGFVI